METKNTPNTNIFNDILDPDLTTDEKITYYEDLLEIAQEKGNKEIEEELTNILDLLISRGDVDDD